MNKKFFFKSRGMAPGTVVYEGDTPPAKTKISVFEITDEKIITHDSIINTKNRLWVRITGLSDSQQILSSLNQFEISSLTLEDIFETYHNPKFDDTFDYDFIIMRSINFNDDMQDNQISFIVMDNILITFEEYECDEFNIVLQRLFKHYRNFYSRGINYLVYALIDAMIDNYIVLLNNINLAVDNLEDTMSTDVLLPCDTSELFYLKRKVNFLSRHTRASHDVVNQLLRLSMEHNNINDENNIVPYYEDLFEHSLYLNEAMQYCKDSIRSVYDENMTRLQMKSNKFINILTMLSTLMLPPMVVGGIFGMNFETIPFSSYPHGFAISIVVMFGISFVLALIFKKKNYF